MGQYLLSRWRSATTAAHSSRSARTHTHTHTDIITSKVCTMKLLCMFVAILLTCDVSLGRRVSGGTCGLTCYRYEKCRSVLNTLTSSSGSTRPGQRGTTGQLIFETCEDPAECNCEERNKPKPPPKPRVPKAILDYVDSSALQWLNNLVDIDQ